MRNNKLKSLTGLVLFAFGYVYGIIDYNSGFSVYQVLLSLNVVLLVSLFLLLYNPNDAKGQKNE